MIFFGRFYSNQSSLFHEVALGKVQEVRVLLSLVGCWEFNRPDKHGCTPLHWAVMNGNGEIVSLLLQYKAEIEAKTQLGETPLAIAKRLGHEDAIRILLANGAKGPVLDECKG